MRPLAGIACRPSVRRTMPGASIPCATARRARASVKAPLWMLKTTKYVTRLGLSRYVARKRGSWRRASASVGKEIRREGEAAGEELGADLLGGDAELEDDALVLRIAFAPVGGVPLQLQPFSRLEARDAVRPRADAALPPALADDAGPLGDDADPRPRHEGGEEGQRASPAR